MSRPIEWIEFEPDHGPPKPIECAGGFQSHTWKLSIAEGRIAITTDCSICVEGFWHITEACDFEMDEIAVRIERHAERQADDVWAWWEIHPLAPDLGAISTSPHHTTQQGETP